MDAAAQKPRVVVVGPLPPPPHGVAVSTQLVLSSPVLRERVTLSHVDTTDRRGLGTIGDFDLQNIVLALEHAALTLHRAARLRPAVVYLTLSQGLGGLLRDAALVAAARLAGGRVVLHLHGGNYLTLYRTASRPVRLLLRACLERAECVIVLGDSLVGMVRGIVPGARVFSVPNGAPPVLGDGEPPRRERAGAAAPRVLFLSGLRPAKGVYLLLECARRLRDEGVPAHFVVAGPWDSEEYRRRGEEYVAAHRLGDVVTFTGEVSGADRAREYAQADVFVLPSYNEGQPFVVLEAISAGLPVVGSDTGVIADMVHDGENGLVVPPGDLEALVAAVRRLATDAGLRAEYGEASWRRYRAEYTVQVSHRRLAEVFLAAAGGR